MNKRFLEKDQWIVADYSTQQLLKEQLLSSSKALTGIKMMTLNQLLLSIMPFTSEKFKLFTSAYTIIQEKRADCTVLNESICYPSVVSQLIDFATLSVQFNLDTTSLPETTQKDIECKMLVEAIIPLFSHLPSLNKLEALKTPLSHVKIYPSYTTIFESKILSLLKAKGAIIEQLPDIQPRKVLFYSALNLRQEIEGCVQHILTHPETTFTILLANPTTYLPTITSVFSRYNLPFSTSLPTTTAMLQKQIHSLLQYYKKPSVDLLTACISNQTFKSNYAHSFIEYLNQFEIDIQTCFHPFQLVENSEKSMCHIDVRDRSKLLQLEKEAEFCRLSIEAQIQIDSNEDPIVKTYDYFASQYAMLTPIEQSIFQQFKTIIEHVFFATSDPETQHLIISYALETLNVPNKQEQAGVQIIPLEQLPYHEDTSTFIVLGCDQKSYPAFSSYKGLFDEPYASKTRLPDLTSRLQWHLTLQRRIFSYASNLIFSYAYANYEGKMQTCAFEIESFAKHHSPQQFWPLKQQYTPFKQTYQLDPTVSSNLFFKENQLRGSISSFERFFQCPYQYFFQYGLKLQPIDYFSLNAAFIGTIQHYILESLSKEDSKNYATIPYEVLVHAIDESMNELDILYPKKKPLWALIRRKMSDNLFSKLEFIQKMEQDTSFQNTYQEFKYHKEWQFNQLPSISIQGIIDRIDETTTHFRIIDYKSSEKRLSEKKVEGGMQLQLPTYALIASSLISKSVSGAYYLSLKNEDVPEIARKVLRDKIIELDETDLERLWLKEHKLTGWTFDSPTTFYNSDQFVTGLTARLAVRGGNYQMDLIESQLNRLYEYLLISLKEGNIERRPVESTCTYCDYKDICRYRGKTYPPLEHLKDPKLTLQGKERKDASDEMDE